MALPVRFSLLLISAIGLFSCTHQPSIHEESHSEEQSVPQTTEIQQSIHSLEPSEQLLYYINTPGYLNEAKSLWEDEGPFFQDDPLRQNLILQKLFAYNLEAPEDLLNVSLLQVDKDDLWVGTWTGGIFRYSLALNQWEEIKKPVASLSVNSSHGIWFEDQWIWLLGYNWLSRYWKHSSKVESLHRTQPPSKIQDMILYQDRVFLATAGNGIYTLDQENKNWNRDRRFDKAGPFINKLLPSEKGFWVCTTDRGLYLWDGEKLSEEVTGFPGLNVTTLIEDQDSLWVGTYGRGLLEMEQDRRTFYSSRLNLFPDDWIISSLKTESYLIWGTLGGGIYLQDESGRNITLTLQDGLASMDIAALAWYNDALYVGNLGGGITVIHENIIQFRLQNAKPVSR